MTWFETDAKDLLIVISNSLLDIRQVIEVAQSKPESFYALNPGLKSKLKELAQVTRDGAGVAYDLKKLLNIKESSLKNHSLLRLASHFEDSIEKARQKAIRERSISDWTSPDEDFRDEIEGDRVKVELTEEMNDKVDEALQNVILASRELRDAHQDLKEVVEKQRQDEDHMDLYRDDENYRSAYSDLDAVESALDLLETAEEVLANPELTDFDLNRETGLLDKAEVLLDSAKEELMRASSKCKGMGSCFKAMGKLKEAQDAVEKLHDLRDQASEMMDKVFRVEPTRIKERVEKSPDDFTLEETNPDWNDREYVDEIAEENAENPPIRKDKRWYDEDDAWDADDELEVMGEPLTGFLESLRDNLSEMSEKELKLAFKQLSNLKVELVLDDKKVPAKLDAAFGMIEKELKSR